MEEQVYTTSFPAIHQDFSINGIAISKDNIKEVATRYSIEGEVYEQDVALFLLDWISPKHHITVSTSGSTGTPKRIKVHKQHMIQSALATGAFFKVNEHTTALLCLSASYIAGKMMLVRAMTLGWKLDIIPPKTNPLDTVYKQYDFCAMVPLQLDNSLNRLHLIKKLIVGGGAVSEYLKKLVQGIPTKIYETYGMTETVSHIAAKRINPKKKEKIHFKALPNITLTIDDRGCLVIKAPLLSENNIVTNDIVMLKTYKKFIWKGRYDNVINSGGVKLYPEEIEAKLQPFIRHRFFVTSLPDDVLGNKVVLIVEHSDDLIYEENIKKIIHMPSLLHKYEIPKKIYFLKQFVETSNGKLQRKQTVANII